MIVTGAAKNMGRAFAETLGKNGTNVIVHDVFVDEAAKIMEKYFGKR